MLGSGQGIDDAGGGESRHRVNLAAVAPGTPTGFASAPAPMYPGAIGERHRIFSGWFQWPAAAGAGRPPGRRRVTPLPFADTALESDVLRFRT